MLKVLKWKMGEKAGPQFYGILRSPKTFGDLIRLSEGEATLVFEIRFEKIGFEKIGLEKIRFERGFEIRFENVTNSLKMPKETKET